MINKVRLYLKRWPWAVPISLGLAVLIGLTLWFVQTRPVEAGQVVYETARVYRSNLSTTITGTGTLVKGRSVDLGFSVDGKVREINVQPGDWVTTGQVLATLDEVEKLEIARQNWQLQLQEARKNLNDLSNGGDRALAQALSDYAAARQTYQEAKSNLRQPGESRCDPAQTETFYYAYIDAQRWVNEWEGYLESGNTGYGRDFILKVLAPMRQERDRAYANMNYCESYTGQEILESEAALQLAEAHLQKTELVYRDLLKNSGSDLQDIEIAQATVANAESQLTKAQKDLEGATIVAPMDGTVIAVNTKEGDEQAGLETVITLADLENPRLQVIIDETDLPGFSAGCTTQITFNAIPGRTFAGVITDVFPELGSMNNANVKIAQGLAELNETKLAPGKTLPLGLSGTADITCTPIQGALLIPASAVVETAGNSPFVYVLGADGNPERRTVETGVKGTTVVEVRNGLSENENVIVNPAGLG